MWDFLRPRTATSLFLSANLHDHGLNATGHTAAHPKATRFWVAETGGDIRAVFGCAQNGFVNCEAPDFNPDWSADLRRAEARANGVKSAVLFALGLAAVRAYQSIGLTRCGDYSQILFADPVILGDPT